MAGGAGLEGSSFEIANLEGSFTSKTRANQPVLLRVDPPPPQCHSCRPPAPCSTTRALPSMVLKLNLSLPPAFHVVALIH